MKDLNANASSIKAPLLMVHGTKDAVTSPDAAKAFAGSVGSSDVTLNMVDGGWQGGGGG
jgi:alpha-beta hydrolase superfamily lysophospholipase